MAALSSDSVSKGRESEGGEIPPEGVIFSSPRTDPDREKQIQDATERSLQSKIGEKLDAPVRDAQVVLWRDLDGHPAVSISDDQDLSSREAKLVVAWLEMLPAEDLRSWIRRADYEESSGLLQIDAWLSEVLTKLEISGAKSIDWNAKWARALVDAELRRNGGDYRDLFRSYQTRLGANSSAAWPRDFLGLLCCIFAADAAGAANREFVTDALIRGLRRISVARPGAVNPYLRFVEGLFAVMWFDTKSWTMDRQLTLGGLAELVSNQTTEAALRLAVVLNERSLHRLLESGIGRLDLMVWRRARISCNNTTNQLSTLAGFDSGVDAGIQPDRQVLAVLMNRLQTVSMIGNILDARIGDSEEVQEVEQLYGVWKTFGFKVEEVVPVHWRDKSEHTAIAVEQLSVGVRAMLNVVSGWAYLDEQLHAGAIAANGGQSYTGESVALLLSSLGGVLRARRSLLLNEDHEEPVSSLFNAGLSVGRLRRTLTGRQQTIRAGETIYYALGLAYGVLRGDELRDGAGYSIAMSRFHGDSCMVNLAGCWSDLAEPAFTDPELRVELLKGIAFVLDILDHSELRATQEARLRASLDDLRRFRSEAGKYTKRRLWTSEEVLDRMVETIGATTSWLVRQKALPIGAGPGNTLTVDQLKGTSFVLTSARLIVPVMNIVLNKLPTQTKVQPVVAALLHGVMERLWTAEDPQTSATLLEDMLWTEPMSSPSGQGTRSQRRTVLQNVLTAPGCFEHEEWIQAFAASGSRVFGSPLDYTDLLSLPGVLAWLPNVEARESER